MEPYIPDGLPLSDLDYGQLIGPAGEAHAALARYDDILQSVVNPRILLSSLTTQEAVFSSMIEGTQVTLDEVLKHEARQSFDDSKTQDLQEVVNYNKALDQASEQVQEQPLSLELIRQMHAIMQDTVRGKNREPGQFRKDQNWIGPWACTIKDAAYVVRQHNREPGQFRKNQNWIGPWGGSIEDAHFVPPSPLQMLDHLQAWEGYLNNDDSDCLVQAAVVHAQFELIHPFKDGNGRIGRLLIPLFLFNKGALSHPMFYLSAYLEENRYEYHERLRGISESGQWSEWIAFFLKAVSIQARDNAERIQRTLTLYEQMKEHIQEFIYSKYTNQFLDALFERPIFQTSDLVKRSGLAKKTVMPLLRQLKSEMVFRSLCEASGRRAAILSFPALLKIAEGRFSND